MALTAICAKIKTPIFSIKHPETYQISAALPIPQPSALIGALAYCLGVEKGSGTKILKKVREAVILARAKMIEGVTTVNPILLRRFRILDRGLERDKKGGTPLFLRAYNALSLGDVETFRKIIEGKLTDALYREYLSNVLIKCIWVLKKTFDSSILYFLQRLGDTESLITVIDAWTAKCCAIKLDSLSTGYPFVLDFNILKEIYGSYITLKMCDEERKLKMYCIPCKRDIFETSIGTRYFAYSPTEAHIKLRSPQTVFIIDEEKILGIK